MNPYKSPSAAQEYLAFLDSRDGQIQQKVLLEAIQSKLANNSTLKILDAACGSGWLSKFLNKNYTDISGFDSSEVLISHAKTDTDNIDFVVANIANPLPFEQNQFDSIILNMAATDLSKPVESFQNLFQILKPGGNLLVTIPNPYYAYPIGVWKRNIIDRILGRKPKLKLRTFPYNSKELLPSWNPKHPISHYYSLTDHVGAGQQAGFTLSDIVEIKSTNDSQQFDLYYRLYRYPLFLLLEFIKPPV